MKVRIDPRFFQPMTPELLDELRAYIELYDAEVTRVANVCNPISWERFKSEKRISWRPRKRKTVAFQGTVHTPHRWKLDSPARAGQV